MIPYFEIIQINIAGFGIKIWGLLVASGFVFGALASARFADKRGLNKNIILDAVPFIIIFSMIGARLFHVLFYAPFYFAQNPIEIFYVWQGGFSVIGGLLGATAYVIYFLKKRKLDFWKYADALIFGLPLGLFIGRIGCFLIHDHPGVAVENSIFGIKYPDGIIRLDHGFLLSLDGLVLFLIFLAMARRRASKSAAPAAGVFVATFLVWHGTVRFILDFLRATDGAIVDSRYFGLTPAQYASILMILGGVYIWKVVLKKR